MQIEDYLKINYRMLIQEDEYEGGYVISFPDLPGCLTCGDTIEEAMNNAKDAKRTWLEAAIEDGVKIKCIADELEEDIDTILKLVEQIKNNEI